MSSIKTLQYVPETKKKDEKINLQNILQTLKLSWILFPTIPATNMSGLSNQRGRSLDMKIFIFGIREKKSMAKSFHQIIGYLHTHSHSFHSFTLSLSI
jgi:hypothetical protein